MTSILKTDEIQSQNGGAVVKMQTLKHPSASGNNITLDSSNNVSLGGTLSTGTIGGNVVFPSGHIVQAVYNPTLTNTSTSTVTTTSDTGKCDITGQITIASGNHVLIYCQAFMIITGGTNAYGDVSIYQGTSASLGSQLSQLIAGDSSGNVIYCPISFWAYDSNPQDATTPDYAIAISRASGGTTNVSLSQFTSPNFQFYLFEVKA